MGKKSELWSTFRGNNNFPVYNWFYFTEAYSRGLVRNILLKHVHKENAKLVDPFCGTGTSLLVGKEFGFDVTGFDVSPIMCLISKIKTDKYDLELLDELLTSVADIDNKPDIALNEKDKWIKRFFYKENLDALLKLKANIDLIESSEKYFFYGVLYKTLETVTRAEKRGSAIRVRKIRILDTLKIFNRHYNQFVKDIKKFYNRSKDVDVQIFNEGVGSIKDRVNNVDIIVCSPPYPNKTEYTKRMGVELAFFGFDSILEKHLGTKDIKREKEYLYINMFSDELNKADGNYKMKIESYDLDNYFIGLENFVNDSYDVLNKDGILSITIAGGCFRNFALDIYDYMVKLYEQAGFKLEDIKTDRDITCHKDRTIQIGKIREFTIVGRKV